MMSTYNLCFAKLELATGEGPCATVEISGSSFPEPSSDQLSLSRGVLTGSFAADEGAPLVDSFTFTLPDEENLAGVSLQFEGYPEDYTGVQLSASVDFTLGGEDFSLKSLSTSKQDNKKGVGVVLTRSIGMTGEPGDSIISFNETTTEYNGQSRAAGDLTIVETSKDNLDATCSSGVDFNALSDPWLICWNNGANPDDKIFLASVTVKDNG